jgi:hypothetical protein
MKPHPRWLLTRTVKRGADDFTTNLIDHDLNVFGFDHREPQEWKVPEKIGSRKLTDAQLPVLLGTGWRYCSI